MPKEKLEQLILSLTPNQAEALLWDWRFWARPEQLPPTGRWLHWLLRSGRGFGKTRTGAETVNGWARERKFKQILIAGRTAGDVRSLQVEGPSGIIARSPPWFMPNYEPSLRQITWPNGVVGVIRYGDEPDGFRGFEGGGAWLDELFHWKYATAAYDNLMLGMREKGAIRIMITSTPKPTELCKRILKHRRTIDVKGSTYDNRDNLSAEYFEDVVSQFEGSRVGLQELYGEVLTDTPGAQWKYETIARFRVEEPPELERVVVAVDPATSYGEKSDETGIVVAGRGVDRHAYPLADRSGRYAPDQWARQVVKAFREFEANLVVAETNNGGDMVEHTLRTVDPNIPIKKIHAKKAKRIRAEPVAALYEQGKVHHVGLGFSLLEDQLVSTDLDDPKRDGHDDRLDALVYAITELMPGRRSLGDRLAAMV